MMKKYHTKFLILLVTLLSFFSVTLAGCGKQQEGSNIPTILIHGSPGSEHSFDTMTKMIEKRVDVTEEPLMEVTSNDRLIMHGRWKDGKNPLVVLRFVDSTANEDKRARWLSICMRYLYQHHGVRQVNLVGHSMGGIDILYYATYYQYHQKDLPKVNKVVSLGAPFNGCDFSQNGSLKQSMKNGPKEESHEYKMYAELMKEYPLKAKAWLNIAGDKLSDGVGDLVVPLGSVACITPLMKQTKVHYEFEVFKGEEHSELHDDSKVIDRMVKFLWE